MTVLRPNIVFHARHFVRHLWICNPICVKLLQIMSGVIPSNLKEKRRLYLKPFSWGPQTRYTHTDTHTHTHTHTHTRDHSIRRNAMRCISPKNGIEFKKGLQLTNKYDSKSVFFWRYHSFKQMIFIRLHCQSFFQRMIKGELCWRQRGNLRSDGKDQRNAIKHLRPEAWRKELCHGIFAFIRIWGRHKIELAGVVLQPRPRSGMGFVSNYDGDDIYDSKHRLKGPKTWLEKDCDTISNITYYTITDINQNRWGSLEASPFTSFFN